MKKKMMIFYIAAFVLLTAAGTQLGARETAPALGDAPELGDAPLNGTVQELPGCIIAEPTPDALAPIHSSVDFDGDGVDDYTDILLGARAEAERHPAYDVRYWPDMDYDGLTDAQLEGYPPDEMGVCTDVIWRAFRDAGYDLKAMIDADRGRVPDEYDEVGAQFDSNIDFRFSEVQDLFFSRWAVALTIDASDVMAWQPGDVVVYEGHIGIVSDIRRADGLPYLIHNTDMLLTGHMEEDALDSRAILAHYRWDASLIDPALLAVWEG